MFKERRSSARIEAAYPARLRGVDIEGQHFKEQTLSQNLSAGGLYLRLRRAVREGAPISVAVRLSTAPDVTIPVLRLAARGTVLRVEPNLDGSYGVAVRFERRRVL